MTKELQVLEIIKKLGPKAASSKLVKEAAKRGLSEPDVSKAVRKLVQKEKIHTKIFFGLGSGEDN